MSEGYEYFTIEKESEGIFKDKGSKFFAFAYNVDNEEQIEEIRKNLKKKYHDARHHVYAYRIGTEDMQMKSSDDGEPSNSSGPPVLGQIRSFELTNILIVVVRYFGGTKLGVPGLINAYKSAAKDAIENNQIVKKTVKSNFEIKFEYPEMNNAMRIIKELNLEIIEQVFELNCYIKLQCDKSKFKATEQIFSGNHKIEFKKL